MATVYLAIQENFQREVALKVMSPALSESGDFSERFLREARIVSRLVHPNIVTVHDVGIENGHHYLSMEYIEGQDLKERINSLTGKQKIRVLAEVAKALDYAGRKGYVHRDVKPENIMINNHDGRAILMDFGIARAADSMSTMTRTGTALGTPHYMSPEQARGQTIDGRSDLYSLGVLLHYMLVGKVPYEADSSVAVGIMHVSAKLPKLPEGLSAYQFLIDKLMAKSPDDRYQTGNELVEDLRGLDTSAIDIGQPTGDYEYLASREHTPRRNDKVNSLPDAGLFDSHPEVKAVKPRAVHADLQGLFHDSGQNEAIHIPKEDLHGRVDEGKGSNWLALVLVLLLVGVGASYSLYRAGEIPLPPQYAALIDQHVPDTIKDVVFPNLVVPISVTDAQSVDNDSSEENDGVAQADMSPATADGQLAEKSVEELLLKSRELAEIIDQQPERMPELLNVYTRILEQEPQQAEVLESITTLKADTLSTAAAQLDSDDIPAAQDSLDIAVAWFPELSEDERYSELRLRLETANEMVGLLALANQQLSADRLLNPAGDNAKATFDRVLVIDPDNSDALEGLQKIVSRYGVLAKSALNKNDYDRAQRLVSSGLSVDASDTSLQGISKQLAAIRTRQEKISQLLADAGTLNQQQYWFDGSQNAVQKYLQVLALEPKNAAAMAGVEQVVEDFAVDIDGLIAFRDYESASLRTEKALAVLPDNEILQLIAERLESLAPAIDYLVVSGEAINPDVEPMAKLVGADRTLYLAFNYENLVQPATVLQALLFDGTRSVQIAGVPVVVQGEAGSTQFRIDRPVVGFAPGGYHIDILLSGSRIFTHSFVID